MPELESVSAAAPAQTAAQLALVQEALGIATWIWQTDRDRVTWYGDLAPLLGLRAGSFGGCYDDYRAALHPEDRDGSLACIHACLKGERREWRHEERVVWPDRSVHWLETYGRAAYGADGRAVEIAGVVHDITARRQTEAARAASERRFRGLIEQAPVAIAISRGETLVYANLAFAAMFGFADPQAVAGSDVVQRVAPDARARYAQLTRDRLAGHDVPRSYELAVQRLDGTRFIALVALTDIALEDGPATLVFLHDDTDRSRAAAALEALSASLEERVRERTAELARSNAALAQARDAAEAATRSRSDFLAHMSHEIRTPMNAIIGLTDLALRQDALTPRLRTHLDNVRAAASSLLQIVNRILDFSKIDAGQLELERGEFRLGEMLDRVGSLLAVDAAAKGLLLRNETAADVPQRLIGDALRIGQVLLNLGGNAVKFTDRGEVALTTALARWLGDGRALLRFAVRDTGIGIDERARQRLFRPFDQLDASITRRYGGTGLGLVIAERLVTSMGGTIEVRSAPGEGSEFAVELPLKLAAGPTTKPPAPPAGTARLRGARILLVEDNELNRLVATDLLAGVAGAQVTAAADGREALERLRAERYDLVLMDLQMPVMDGYEATARLRRDPRLAGLPIVAMTAHAMAHDRERCLAIGMTGFVSKPVEAQTLFDVVARALDAGPPAAAVPSGSAGEPLSVEAGLASCLGRESLYAQILQRFLATHGDDPAALRRSLDAGDARTASRIAHTMVSTAGTIGAQPLSALARALERSIAAGTVDGRAELLARFAHEHERTLGAARGLIGPDGELRRHRGGSAPGGNVR